MYIAWAEDAGAHAYKFCTLNSSWAEKANYSECLSLLSESQQEENTTTTATARNKMILARYPDYYRIRDINIFEHTSDLSCSGGKENSNGDNFLQI